MNEIKRVFFHVLCIFNKKFYTIYFHTLENNFTCSSNLRNGEQTCFPYDTKKTLYVTLIDVTFDAGLHALETNHFPLIKRRKKAMWIRIQVIMYLNICSAIYYCYYYCSLYINVHDKKYTQTTSFNIKSQRYNQLHFKRLNFLKNIDWRIISTWNWLTYGFFRRSNIGTITCFDEEAQFYLLSIGGYI